MNETDEHLFDRRGSLRMAGKSLAAFLFPVSGRLRPSEITSPAVETDYHQIQKVIRQKIKP